MSIPVQKAFLDYYGNTNNSLAFPGVCGTGNSILVIGMNCYSGTGYMTIADNELNSYTLIDSFQYGGGITNSIQVWLATNIAVGTQTITLDGPGGINFMAIGMWELPGIWAKDVQSIGIPAGSSPSYTLGAITTNYADFCVECMGANAGNTISTASPWTQETMTGGRTDAFCFGEYLQSSPGSITANFTVTSPTYPQAYVGGFYQLSSGIPGALSMMGCGAS